MKIRYYTVLSYIEICTGDKEILITTPRYARDINTEKYHYVYDQFTYEELLKVYEQIKDQVNNNCIHIRANKYDDLFIKNFQYIRTYLFDDAFTDEKYKELIDYEFECYRDEAEKIMDDFYHSINDY